MLGAAGCAQPSVPATFSVEPIAASSSLPVAPQLIIDLLKAGNAIDALARRRITVDDPVYKQRKTYEGPLLRDVIRLLVPDQTIPKDAQLVLVCLDGYRASLTWAMAQGDAVLARRDVDAPSVWLALPTNGDATPSPFYLVWEPSPDAASRPWPYGVSGIEVWATDPLERAKPGEEASEAVRSGFALFANHCAKCHRLNGAGGALSTELNVPANVTEYWKPEALRAFIRQPSSVQAGARMPAFPGLAAGEIDQLMTYLEAMKRRKLTP